MSGRLEQMDGGVICFAKLPDNSRLKRNGTVRIYFVINLRFLWDQPYNTRQYLCRQVSDNGGMI